MKLKIEEGKYYRSRDGHIYGPMEDNGYGFVVEGGNRIDHDERFDWYVNGRVSLFEESPQDLIEEVSMELPEYLPDNRDEQIELLYGALFEIWRRCNVDHDNIAGMQEVRYSKWAGDIAEDTIKKYLSM